MEATIITVSSTAIALLTLLLFPRHSTAAGIVVITVASASLVLSYWVFNSTSWQNSYDRAYGGVRIGSFVELGRTLLAVGVMCFILCRWFNDEFRRLLLLDRLPSWWAARGLFAVVLAITLVALWTYHLDQEWVARRDPGWAAWLQANPSVLPSERADRFYAEYQRPYLFYMPYSMINFVTIAVPLFVVPIVGGVRNARQGDERRRQLCKCLSNQGPPEDGSDPFLTFRRAYEDMAERYIAILSGAFLLLAFELLIAHRTLSEDARVLSYFAVALIAATSSTIVVLGFQYEQGFKTAQKVLDVPGSDWGKQHHAKAVLTKILSSNIAGLLIVGVGGLVGIVAVVEKWLNR